MNNEEFLRFQKAIQWAADEAKTENSHHVQRHWGYGIKTDLALDVSGWWGEGVTTCFAVKVDCGSTMCLAGNGVIAAGDHFVDTGVSGFGGKVSVTYCVDADGVVRTISDRAQQLFGLTESEARRMFQGDNNLDHIIDQGRRIARHYGFELQLT